MIKQNATDRLLPIRGVFFADIFFLISAGLPQLYSRLNISGVFPAQLSCVPV
jgi:hypothetical protein